MGEYRDMDTVVADELFIESDLKAANIHTLCLITAYNQRDNYKQYPCSCSVYEAGNENNKNFNIIFDFLAA